MPEYRVLSPNGGLVNVRIRAKDNPDGDIYEVLDGSGRIMTINNLSKLLKETREAQAEWGKLNSNVKLSDTQMREIYKDSERTISVDGEGHFIIDNTSKNTHSSVAPGVTAGGLSKPVEIKQLSSAKPVLALPQPNASRIESQRSKRAQGADESRTNSLIIDQSDPRLEKWVRNPGSMDVLGIDTPPNISQTTERISKRESHITRRSGSLGSKMPRISQRTPRIK